MLHSSAAAAAAVSAAMTASTNPYFPFLNPASVAPGCDQNKLQTEAKEKQPQPETCSNVVSSTMEDDDSSSREGFTPLTSVKVCKQTADRPLTEYHVNKHYKHYADFQKKEWPNLKPF